MERKFVEKEGSYSYSEARECTWFYTGIVNERQLFPLYRQDIPSVMIPGDFAAPFRVKLSVMLIKNIVNWSFSVF
jgi:hypothetical protein